ncbi:MAG: heavy metal transporter [Pirellulales bacterium]|nr:heavy metal transporter [Pirellulales bacterium]
MDSQKVATRWFLAALIAVALQFPQAVWAAEPSTKTVITTRKLCPVCGKKITEELRQIKGVADARMDINSKTFVVLPIRAVNLSPRLLWETVERGGEQPIRLIGPSGTFEEKPKA